MNKNSIFLSITLAFISLFILLIISLFILLHDIHKRENFVNAKRSFDIAHLVLKEMKHKGYVSQELKESLELFDFIYLEDKQSILRNDDLHLIWKNDKRKVKLTRYDLDGKNYLYIKLHKTAILLLDKNEIVNSKNYILAVFAFLFIGFFLLYLRTIKKLQPLATLQKQVKTIGEENFDIECATDKRDEISQLANEFDKTAKKLKNLKESRNIFIRNIMHELKTPIAKGQFLTQLPDTQANKESMQKVFYRLEALINEFASIEELISTKKVLTKKEYYLSDIVDNASDILMNQDKNLIQSFENIKVNVDFKLFSIAVKNLIDNGIKYSKNRVVTVKTKGSIILFENAGAQLDYPLESYFEAFFQSETKSTQSFGLGLYIVKHILDANGMKLEYKYENGVNRFAIIT